MSEAPAPALLPCGPVVDPEAAARAGQRLAEAAAEGGWDHALHAAWPALAPVFAASPYLFGLARRWPDFLHGVLRDGPDLRLEDVLARTAALAGGAVMLRARRRSSGEIEFSVTDTGPGVPEADRERVLQRFVRLDNSRSEPGSGLGLSLVGAVLEAHGGRVQLDEGPGEYGGFGPGLRVALVLPPATAA